MLTMHLTKQKILEMLLIAILSAFISFLQNIISQLVGQPQDQISVLHTMGIGTILGSFRFFKYV
jgi:hypothetical protein